MKNKLLLLFLIATLIVPIVSSYATPPNTIGIFGDVSNSAGETIHIMKTHMINNATGSSSSIFLVGDGVLIPRNSNNSMSQYYHFHVEGNMSTNTIFNFAGNITKSSDPSTIGKPILITADTATGNTILVFGYSNYTGIENVIIK